MRYLTVHGAIMILLGVLMGIALNINSGCTCFIANNYQFIVRMGDGNMAGLCF